MEQHFKGRIRRTLESTRNFGKLKEILLTILKHTKREKKFAKYIIEKEKADKTFRRTHMHRENTLILIELITGIHLTINFLEI